MLRFAQHYNTVPSCRALVGVPLRSPCRFLLGARHLDATPTTTASQLRDLDAVDCSFEGAQHIGTLDIGSCLFQPLLSPAPGFLCTSFVDLLRVFRCVGQHRHDVITHLEEAAGNEQRLLGITEFDTHFADSQRCEQCRVARQDAEHALCSPGDYHVGLAIVDLTLSSHHLNMQCVVCCHRLALLLLCFVALHNFIDWTDQVEVLFGDMVVLAFQDLL